MTTPDLPPSRPPPSPPLPPAQAAARPPFYVARRVRPRTWRGWLLLFFLITVAILGGGWILTRAAPPWYRPLDAGEQRVIDLSDRGQALLLDLHNKVQRVPRGKQTWTISQDELNSTIAIQFARAVDAGATAPVISGPLVIFTPGQVTVSARTTRLPSLSKAGGVASVVFNVSIVPGPDGKPMGFVQLSSVWAGCLPVPKSIVETRLQSMVPTISATVQRALQAQFNLRESSQWADAAQDVVRKASVGQPFPLEFKVDHKQLVIQDLRVEEGRFTVVIAPPSPTPPTPPIPADSLR